MSIEAMVWAMNLAPVPYDKTKPSAACAAVLLGLANHAGPDGKGAFPKVETLMRYTRLSRRTVITALDRLEEERIIVPCDPDLIAATIKRADRRPNGYDLDMDRYRDDLSAEELDAVARSNPMLRGAVAAILAAGSDEVQPLHVVDVTRGATDASRGAMGAPRGATSAPRGAAAAPEPSKNPPGEPTPEPSLVGAADASPEKKTTRGTRLPDDWAPSAELQTWWREHTELHNIDPRFETEKFCDYWRSQSGQRATKTDWAATWRNWIRSAAERARPRTQASRQPQVPEAHRDRVNHAF